MNILRYFRKKKDSHSTMWKTYNINDHTSFGNLISWQDYDKRLIYGFKHGIVQGDYILSPMESGKLAKFRITRIEYMRSPTDQFFAKVEFLNYEKS